MITAIKPLYKLRTRRNPVKIVSAALRLTLCLVLIFQSGSLATLKASAAVNLFVNNLSEGTLSNEGTHYQIDFPSEVSEATFNVSVSGAEYGSNLKMRTFLVESQNHPVVSIIPDAVQISDSSPILVSIRLSDNPAGTAQSGDVELSFIYEATNSPLGNVVIRVNRESNYSSGDDFPETETGDGFDNDYDNDSDDNNNSDYGNDSIDYSSYDISSIVESTTVMPKITIDGDTAILRYRNPEAVSWGEPGPGLTLTISDVSLLEKDSTFVVPGPRTGGGISDDTLVLPEEQINAVLAAKADYIAETVLAGAVYKEEWDDSGDGRLFLVPDGIVAEQNFVEINPFDERFASAWEHSLAMFAESVELLESINEDITVEVGVLYKGMESSKTASVTIPVTNSEYFPGLYELAINNGIDFSFRSNKDGSSADGGVVGGIAQNYDPNGDYYIQRIDSNNQFRSNIPNGMSTNSPVTFDYTPGMRFELYKDGERIEYLSGQALSESGRYNVYVYAPENNSAVPANDTGVNAAPALIEPPQKTYRFDFDIIGGAVSGPLYYNAPAGFSIVSAMSSGADLSVADSGYIELSEDGEYTVDIAMDGSGSGPEYTVNIKVHSAAPILRLSGVSNGSATYRKVKLAPDENVAKMTVLRNSQPYLSSNIDSINLPGIYTVTVEDFAGNFTQYQFRVLFSMNMSGMASVFLTAALIIGLSMYLFYVRTHMKVR